MFETPADYLRAVSRETDGKYHRSANKAKRAGYFTRRIGIGSHAQSLFDLRASKDCRSHGAMVEAIGGFARPAGDDDIAPAQPACLEHWRIDWGLFNKSNATMWGFASLIRAGNLLQLDHMIVHADVLATGGMKLMQTDVMTWLLERKDPLVVGLGYLLHGAIEHGSEGAADWRRYVHQRPHAIMVSNPERSRLPSDFDPETYLILNPDVRAAGVDARRHYLRHGMVEGRLYKVFQTDDRDGKTMPPVTATSAPRGSGY
jgi:hypothetical protein